MRGTKKNGGLSSFFFRQNTGRQAARSSVDETERTMVISGPTNVKRVGHISYRAATGVFSNLQELGTGSPNLFFGAPIASQPRVEVEGYEARIPSILILLVRLLISREGLTTEGIFRVPGESTAIQRSRLALNEGRGIFVLEHEEGCQVIASLMKDWFKSLPESLLGKISVSELKRITTQDFTPEEIYLLVNKLLDEPNRTVFRWIIDLLAVVCAHTDKNRMTSPGLSIVFAPTLWYKSEVTSDVFAVVGDVVKILEKSIQYISTGDLVKKEQFFRGIEVVPKKTEHEEEVDKIWIRKIHPKTHAFYYENVETGVTMWDKPTSSPKNKTEHSLENEKEEHTSSHIVVDSSVDHLKSEDHEHLETAEVVIEIEATHE